MAYTIAPANSGSELGLAQMRYGLHNSVNYNAANLYTAGPTGMKELVSGSTTYQASLTSKTWNDAAPYGFNEMYGQTWNDTVASTVSYVFTESSGTGTFTIKVNGSLVQSGTATESGNFAATVGDTITVFVSHENTLNPSTIQADYRQPGGGGSYTTLFFQNNLNGDPISDSGSFVLSETTADINLAAGGGI